MLDKMLAVRQANSVVFHPASSDGLAEFVAACGDDGDTVVVNGKEWPLLDESFRMSVVQNGSVAKDKALAKHIGQIRIHLGEDTEGDMFFDELYLSPISVLGYSFSKFDKYDGKASTPICSSQNGMFPTVKNDVTPVSRVCAKYDVVNGEVKVTPVCSAATWGADGEAPSCKQSVSVAFLVLPDCIPVTMSLHGTGLSAFNGLLRKRKKAFNVARIKRRDISRYAVRLYTENMGTYVATKFDFVEAPAELGPVKDYTAVARHFRDTLFSVKAADRVEYVEGADGGEEVAAEIDI